MRNLFLKLVKFIAIVIGKLFGFIIPKTIPKIAGFFFKHLYSGYIKVSLKNCGIDFLVSYPLYYEGLEHVTVGDNFTSFSRLRLEAYSRHLTSNFSPQIIIKNNVSINFDCHIACVNRIEIGNNVLMASKVFITDHYHGKINGDVIDTAPGSRQLYSPGPVIIKDNVWIGEGVCIMPNITIEDNCIIGANAIVTKSFPKNSVIGGNPAKLIKTI